MSDYSKEKYLSILSSRLDIAPSKTKSGNDNTLNFSCPYCHEGKSLGKKRRAFIIKNENYRFFCHNCHKAQKFEWFLRDMDTNLFKQYFSENKESLMSEFLQYNRKTRQKKEDIVEVDTTIYMEFSDQFVKAVSINEALDYIKKRKIPKKWWDDIWWYIPQGHPHSNSIIFPLRKEGKIYGYISRNVEYKFFNIFLAGDDNIKIWNYYNVNKFLDCYITESIIDSLYLENSIALNGATASKKLLSEFKSPIFVLDNDKTGVEKTKKMISYGHKVFIMPKELERFKDINEMVCSGVPEKLIPKIIRENTFQGKEALLRLALNF